MASAPFVLALTYIPGLGNKTIRTLVSYLESPELIWETSAHELKKIPGIGDNLIRSVLNHRSEALENALSEIEYNSNINGTCVDYLDKAYPYRLKEITDFPVAIFTKGNFDLNRKKVVAIVGTRKATAYGKNVTREVVNYLKTQKAIIVSGLAYGIDIEAHKAALEQNMTTVGVIASGLDIIYPKTHANYANQMLNDGGLITEYPIGQEPEKQFFPARNRIIAGLADAVIVVEAASKGGALITAYMANDYNREVFAVPGNLHSKYSEGCNHLIRNHKANILTKPEDIGYILNWDEEKSNKTIEIPFEDLTAPEVQLVNFLKDQPTETHIDTLKSKLGLNHSEISPILLELELKDLIESLPGNAYRFNY